MKIKEKISPLRSKVEQLLPKIWTFLGHFSCVLRKSCTLKEVICTMVILRCNIFVFKILRYNYQVFQLSSEEAFPLAVSSFNGTFILLGLIFQVVETSHFRQEWWMVKTPLHMPGLGRFPSERTVATIVEDHW